MLLSVVKFTTHFIQHITSTKTSRRSGMVDALIRRTPALLRAGFVSLPTGATVVLAASLA